MSAPRPLADPDYDNLKHQPPHMLASSGETNPRWWLVKYEKFPDPVLDVWATADFTFTRVSVWFPGATPRLVREFVAGLPAPVEVKPKATRAKTEMRDAGALTTPAAALSTEHREMINA